VLWNIDVHEDSIHQKLLALQAITTHVRVLPYPHENAPVLAVSLPYSDGQRRCRTASETLLVDNSDLLRRA
jgi:hypothetical protein